MKKAAIIYNSKTGTTKKYAEELGAYLKSRNGMLSISDKTVLDNFIN